MNPIAFTIMGLEVRWYGIFIGLGVLLAVYTGTKLAEKTEGLYKDVVMDFILVALLFGILGARLYYVAFMWDYYSQNPGEIFAIRNGGLAIHGGVLAGILVAIVFSKVKKIDFWKLSDVIAPGLALAQGIGRWGNFANQEAHGGPTDLPWGILIDGVKVHPTFLYESILDVGIFIFLYFYLFKHKKFPGQLFLVYIMIYGLGRFFIEGLRTDSLMLGNFRVAQLISIFMILIALAIYYLKSKKQTLIN